MGNEAESEVTSEVKRKQHHKGRKARAYPHSSSHLRNVIHYNPATGVMASAGPYGSRGRRGKDGHTLIRVPDGLDAMEKGSREASYYRADHLAWLYVVGEWPEGWIEHVNALKGDLSMENLVHCKPDGTRWWFGSQSFGEPPRLVMVEGADGIFSEGPLTYVADGLDGGAVVKPIVEASFLSRLSPERTNAIVDDNSPFHKGKFGVDWGVNDDVAE